MTGRERLWNDEERRQVAELLIDGRSMARIGYLMGISRSAVMGRISRDGELHAFVGEIVANNKLARDLRRVRGEPRASMITGPKIRKAAAPIVGGLGEAQALPGSVEPGPAAAPLHGFPLPELGTLQCRWPVAEADVVGGHLFCGRRQLDGSRYCERHHRLAYCGHYAGRKRR